MNTQLILGLALLPPGWLLGETITFCAIHHHRRQRATPTIAPNPAAILPPVPPPLADPLLKLHLYGAVDDRKLVWGGQMVKVISNG